MAQYKAVGYRVRFRDDELDQQWRYYSGCPPIMDRDAFEWQVVYVSENSVDPVSQEQKEDLFRPPFHQASKPKPALDGIARAIENDRVVHEEAVQKGWTRGTIGHTLGRKALLKRCWNCNRHPTRVRVTMTNPGGRNYRGKDFWACPCGEDLW